MLSTTTVRASYQGSGSTGPFSYPFKIFAAADLAVQKVGSTGLVTSLAYPTDYSVAGVGNAAGGSITLAIALATGESLAILRATPLTQPTALRTLGTFFPANHEDAFDRVTMLVQQHQDQLDRSVHVGPSTDPSAFSMTLPTPQANQVVSINDAANGIDLRTVDTASAALVPGSGRTVSSLTNYLANNATFNVEDFGASPTASAAVNTAAIQAAILASLGIANLGQQSTGQLGTVTLKGVYPITTVFCPRYTSIRGLTPKAGFTSTANAPLLVLGRSLAENDWLDIKFRDFEIHGNTSQPGQHGIQGAWTGPGAYAYPLDWANIYIRDIGGDGVHIISDNAASQLIKLHWDNVQVVGAFGMAVHIKVGVFNAALFINSAYTDCGNGFFIEDIGSGSTASEAIRFQNVQFESLGKPLGGSFTVNGTFGFRSTMFTGHYSFDDCYFEGNGNKAGDTTGCNLDVRSPWMLTISHSILASSNNQLAMRFGGQARLEGNFIAPGANRNAIVLLDSPTPGSDFSNVHFGPNRYDAAYTQAQLVVSINSPTTTLTGYQAPTTNYYVAQPRTKSQILRDGATKTADDGAIGYTAIKRLANNSGGSTSIANAGIASICKNTVSAMVIVTEYNNSRVGVFILASARAPVLVSQDAAGKYTITKDTASSLNVYNDAGSGTWVVQNTTGGTALLAVRFLGCEPMEHNDDGFYEAQYA